MVDVDKTKGLNDTMLLKDLSYTELLDLKEKYDNKLKEIRKELIKRLTNLEYVDLLNSFNKYKGILDEIRKELIKRLTNLNVAS